MDIPKTLKIGGQIFTVTIENRSKESGIDKLGTCYGSKNRIWLDTEQPETQMESTLIHEIIEALNWQLNIGLEERQICQIEAGLYQVFKDNKIIN